MLPFMVACGERRDRKRRSWEYKNRGEERGDGEAANLPREKLMKNGVQIRHRKNPGAEKDAVMEGIVRQKRK